MQIKVINSNGLCDSSSSYRMCSIRKSSSVELCVLLVLSCATLCCHDIELDLPPAQVTLCHCSSLDLLSPKADTKCFCCSPFAQIHRELGFFQVSCLHWAIFLKNQQPILMTTASSEDGCQLHFCLEILKLLLIAAPSAPGHLLTQSWEKNPVAACLQGELRQS